MFRNKIEFAIPSQNLSLNAASSQTEDESI